jgi:hypothetical protein
MGWVTHHTLFRSILLLSFSKKRKFEMVECLCKGLIFYPFLLRYFKAQSTGENISSLASNAGDDIYPLF